MSYSGRLSVPSGPGIGSPCGSADGPAEHLVDALDQPVGDGVLEVLGLVVDFGPAHPHHLHQEELDQPVPAQHPRRELLAGRGQPDARIGLVADETRLGQGLHHRRGGARDDAQGRGQLAHRDQLLGGQQGNLRQKYGFQVVFDGVGRQHLTFQSLNSIF